MQKLDNARARGLAAAVVAVNDGRGKIVFGDSFEQSYRCQVQEIDDRGKVAEAEGAQPGVEAGK